MSQIRWPRGWRIEQLEKGHRRTDFRSGVQPVDDWLKKRARQAQDKRLAVTRVLIDNKETIVGYYTLAMGQVSFDKLPHEMARKLPSALLPIITLAWLSVDKRHQGKGLGERLLARALGDCHETGRHMPFVAVLLDCANPSAKRFYKRYDFEDLPGHPMTLMLPWKLLDAIAQTSSL